MENVSHIFPMYWFSLKRNRVDMWMSKRYVYIKEMKYIYETINIYLIMMKLSWYESIKNLFMARYVLPVTIWFFKYVY